MELETKRKRAAERKRDAERERRKKESGLDLDSEEEEEVEDDQGQEDLEHGMASPASIHRDPLDSSHIREAVGSTSVAAAVLPVSPSQIEFHPSTRLTIDSSHSSSNLHALSHSYHSQAAFHSHSHSNSYAASTGLSTDSINYVRVLTQLTGTVSLTVIGCFIFIITLIMSMILGYGIEFSYVFRMEEIAMALLLPIALFPYHFK